MKFLHLSDLHIGKSVNGFSMLAEQKHVFEQVIGYIRTENPAAVVIAGDVYDRAAPGVDAVRLFDDFLTGLAHEGVAVMLISGNHDSPERISYASRLLADKRIYFCGAFNGAMHKVTLDDEYGEVHFWLLPFIKPSSVRGILGEETVNASYDGAIAAAIATAGIDYACRNVLVSHQFYAKAGAMPVRSESELNPVGGIDAVDASIIGQFDYAALGHLHGGQRMGAEHIRYCGSPVKYSFSEWRHKKSLTLVELREKGGLSISELPLTPHHDMREIKGRLDELISDSSFADNKEDYLRVILTDDEEIIDPMGKLRGVYPNIMSLEFENSRTGIDIESIAPGAEKLTDYELFSEFFLEVQGSTMSEAQAQIVRELLEKAGDED